MELFEKIITERITSPLKLSEAERSAVAADPQLQQLIEHNAELSGVRASSPLPPDMAHMLHRVKLAESIIREPARVNILEQIFGGGWQLKSLGSLAACAVLALALYAIPGLLSEQRQQAEQPLVAEAIDSQALLARSTVGTWLEYGIDDTHSEKERELLQEKLQLAVEENSEDIDNAADISLLAHGDHYAVFVPAIYSDDARIARIDDSIRRVEQFSLERRSTRLFLDDSTPGGEIRVISHAASEIAFPRGTTDAQLAAMLNGIAGELPGLGLPQDDAGIRSMVSEGFAAAGYDGSWLALPDDVNPGASQAQPGISEDDARIVANFAKLELRLGNRLENSLQMHELSDEQIEAYRRDMEHELQLHLLLPSNWNSMQRSQLDDYVYRQVLTSCRMMGIDTVDIDREAISVSVNDLPADSDDLPNEPRRLTVDIR